MKTNFYLDGKKITKKLAKNLFGEARLKRYIEEAKQDFFEEPGQELSWFTGHGRFRIEFC